MIDYETLLLPLFYELRRRGLEFGVADYLQVIEALHAGLGLEDADALRRLCVLMWAKSREDQELVNRSFSSFVEPFFFSQQLAGSSEEKDTAPFSPPIASPLPEHTPAFEFGPVSVEAPPQREPVLPSPSSPPTPNYPDAPLSQREMESDFLEGQKAPQLVWPMHALPLPPETRLPISSLPRRRRYYMTSRLPVERREIIEAYRHLRRFQRTGLPEELDTQRTIQRICQTGFFLGPVLRPRRCNQIRLVLLLDQQGSMSPFVLLMDALVASILSNSVPGTVHISYFHDCPDDFLYARPELAGAQPLSEVLGEHVKDSLVLIISDAGAARGHYDGKRVADTQAFLKLLSSYTYLYSWINPLPRERWKTTTAEDIAQNVPMFPFTQEGLLDAFLVLQGHPLR